MFSSIGKYAHDVLVAMRWRGLVRTRLHFWEWVVLWFHSCASRLLLFPPPLMPDSKPGTPFYMLVWFSINLQLTPCVGIRLHCPHVTQQHKSCCQLKRDCIHPKPTGCNFEVSVNTVNTKLSTMSYFLNDINDLMVGINVQSGIEVLSMQVLWVIHVLVY